MVLVAVAQLLGTGIGVAVAPAWWGMAAPLLSLALASAVVFAKATPWRSRVMHISLAGLVFLATAGSHVLTTVDNEVGRSMLRVRGRVTSVRYGANPVSDVTVESATALEGSPMPRGATLRVRNAMLPEDAVVALFVRAGPPHPRRNLTPHPPWPSMRTPDAVATLLASPETIEPGGLVAHARGAVREALRKTLSTQAASIAAALVLGDDSDVEADAIRSAGLAHVLAVSGMHVTLLCGLLLAALRRALGFVPALASRLDTSRLVALCGVPTVLVYAHAAGGSPSAWRAAVTAAVFHAARAMGRAPRALETCAAASILFVAIAPREAMRPAYLLSIVATAAILRHGSHESSSPWEWLKSTAALSLRTTVATAPITLWCFDQLPWTGAMSNAVLAPFASVVMLPLSVGHAALAITSPWLSRITRVLLETCVSAFLAGANAFGTTGRIPLPPLSTAQGLCLALGCAALLTLRRLSVRAVAACALALSLVVFEGSLRHDEQPRGVLRASFLDVGQGDAALLDMPDGTLMAIDTGPSTPDGLDSGRDVIAPLLRARRRPVIDLAVITHPHPDHYGGLAGLLASMPVRELWTNGQAEALATSGSATDVVMHARSLHARVLTPPQLCGKPRLFGAARVEVLHPCPSFDAAYDANDNSLVLLVSFGARRMLFLGDAETHAEQALVARARREIAAVDVIKVGHHGSRTSSTEELLALARPRWAVVSAGIANLFGHPHPEVLARFARHGVHALRIDQVGSVEVRTDGLSLEVRTWRDGRIR